MAEPLESGKLSVNKYEITTSGNHSQMWIFLQKIKMPAYVSFSHILN
jgi:hypothetical protein